MSRMRDKQTPEQGKIELLSQWTVGGWVLQYYDGANAHQIVTFTLSWGEKRKGIRAIGKRCQSWVRAISTLLQFLDTLFLIALHPPSTDTLQPEKPSKLFNHIVFQFDEISSKEVKCWKVGFSIWREGGKSNKSISNWKREVDCEFDQDHTRLMDEKWRNPMLSKTKKFAVKLKILHIIFKHETFSTEFSRFLWSQLKVLTSCIIW